jgi:DNA polymerase III alpha subunit (gram-positive type)
MYTRPSSLRDYNLFFFDSETGGLSPLEADMVEVAAVLTDPTGTKILDEFSAKVFPKKPVNEKAAAVNGYTAEKWAIEAVELDGPMIKMLSMARNAIFTAHNAAFDWGFFETAMKQRFQKWPSDYHRYDTVALSVPLLRHGIVPNLRLETLAKHFGIKHENAHTALADVHACRELFVKVMEIYDGAVEQYARSQAPSSVIPFG